MSLSKPDIVIEFNGTIAILRGDSARGCEYIKAHVAHDPWQGDAQSGIACEPRMAIDIGEAATRDGLFVSAM